MVIKTIGARMGNAITASSGDTAYTAADNATVPRLAAAKSAIVSMINPFN